MTESKPVVSGEELIKEVNKEAVRNPDKIEAMAVKIMRYEFILDSGVVVDRTWLMEQLKNFPKECEKFPDGACTDFLYKKWKEDFERKLLGEEKKN